MKISSNIIEKFRRAIVQNSRQLIISILDLSGQITTLE